MYGRIDKFLIGNPYNQESTFKFDEILNFCFEIS